MEPGKDMGLREFVTETFVEVMTGVHEAAERIRDKHSQGFRGP